LGPSTDALVRLGTTPLAAREELAVVNMHADKRLTSVTYSSKTFNKHFGPGKADIDQIVKVVKDLLPKLPAPEKLQAELAKTADELAHDLKSAVTEIGATASVGFLTDRGTESFSYDWSEHPEFDGSKPLDLLKHIGGNPIAVVAGRGKVRPEDYDTLVKWVRTGYRYFEDYGVPEMKPIDRDHVNKIMTGAKPLAARIDKTIRESLIPSLADGQTAVVIDAKLTSRRFLKTMPPTEEPMPMIEPALVLGVSDAEKLKTAVHEFYAVADDFLEVIRSVDDKHEIPKDFKIERPKEFNAPNGKVWGYVLPAEAGVDTKVVPNAGLSDKVAVLSMSRRHTQRLLDESDPVMAGMKLSTTKPYGAVAALDFTALLNAVAPWVDFGLAKAAEQTTPENAEMTKQHVKAAMEVLHCYHGTIAVTYQEGKITITHARSEFKDVAE
jgi:hypothetical protein